MARVNLENHLFGDPRLMILCAYMENAPSMQQAYYMQCLGMLALLWHESQSEQISIATSDQIRRWTLCPKSDATIEALEGAGFIRRTEDGSWEIVGNDKQIDCLKSNHIKAKSAANARWRKDKEKDDVDAPSISNTNINSLSYSSSSKSNYENKQKSKNTRQPDTVDCVSAETVKVDYEGFVQAWNDNRGRLAACTKLTDDRRKKIKSRLADNPDLSYWIGVIRRFSESNFACESNWAGIDFVIRNETNCIKIMEGRYDNKKQDGCTSISFGEIWENYKKERKL